MAPDDEDGSDNKRSRGNGSKMGLILLLALLAIFSVGCQVVPMMKLKPIICVVDSIQCHISALESPTSQVLSTNDGTGSYRGSSMAEVMLPTVTLVMH